MANKECILVADDVAIDRRIVRMLLRRDYEVEEAADGLEAINHLEANPDRYVCVLLDMLMPVMDGFKVMEYMRAHDLIDRVPVIALTAISDAAGHIRCYESGAVDIIEKPFDQRMLLYKLKFDISRFRQLSGSAPAAAAAPAAEAPVAQKSLLDDVRKHVAGELGVTDPNEMKEFLDTFMESFGECADDLSKLGDNPDVMVIRAVTHKIYGFARTVGAVALDDAALLLNAAAKQNEPAACMAGIRLILGLYADCKSSR